MGVTAYADPAVSQAVRVSGVVVDEFGKPLMGTDASAELFGLPVVEGDLVQILLATDGVIYPPSVNGQPNVKNVVLSTTRIGTGLQPTTVNPGQFSTLVGPRPGGNSKIFVRVFNAPSLEDASFYGDSQVFVVKSFKNEIFSAVISSASAALDSSDTDGDGLNNSWEKSYGSDPSARDTDGDGVTDAEEAVAGTDLLDAQSNLAIAGLHLDSDSGRLVVTWSSAAGRAYDVEFAGNGSAYAKVATVAGNGGTQEYQIPVEQLGQQGWYMVCARQGSPTP